MLCPYTNEKVDLLNIVKALYPRELDANEDISKFLRKFLTFELMPLDEHGIDETIRKYEPFSEKTENNRLHAREFLK
jgi:hypothetical protein